MALEGTLNYLEIADLLKVIGLSRKSGVLEISWEDRHARLFLDRGALVCAQSDRFHEGIGTLLVRAALLSEDALEKALMLQKAQGGVRRLGRFCATNSGFNRRTSRRFSSSSSSTSPSTSSPGPAGASSSRSPSRAR